MRKHWGKPWSVRFEKPNLLPVVVIVFIVFTASAALSQPATTARQSGAISPKDAENIAAPTPKKDFTSSPCPSEEEMQGQGETRNSEGEQTKRMLWVVPNSAAVSAGARVPPLSAHCKFVLAMHDSVDYSSFVWTGIIAGQSFALNADPELGHGVAGYSRYYWRAYVDGFSGTFFTEAIVPAITHEDPRYFTLEHGGFLRRLGYALSRTVVTRNDAGGTEFNWSEAGGNGLEALLSNAYYPPQERGVSETAKNWGAQMEAAALNNIAKEFWPDIRHFLFRQK